MPVVLSCKSVKLGRSRWSTIRSLRHFAPTSFLDWTPLVSSSPTKLLSQLDIEHRGRWLDGRRSDLEKHISWTGTPIFSYALGNGKSYQQIVVDLAEQLDVKVHGSASAVEIETCLIKKLWADTLARLTSEQREELLAKVRLIADQFSPAAGKELVGFAGLAAAQLSGFGVYVLGSTLLGGLNSALGLGLGFSAFTGLSSAISVLIGPIGWAALGLYTIKKLGSPNYKKLLPVAILIASERAGLRPIPPSILLPPSTTSTTGERDLPTPPGPEGGVPSPTLTSSPTATVATEALNFPESWKTSRQADIPAQTAHIKTASVQPKPRPPTAPIRIYSKAERTNFRLRPENRELCIETEQRFPGIHYLELSLAEQQIIGELRQTKIERDIEAVRANEELKRIQARETRKKRKREQTGERAAKKKQVKVD
jgi:uncharacterized protein YaaW (UPF0174 family)